MTWLIEYFLPFVLILSVLVFVHEWGHFWVARKNGVRVTVFSIGFGPEIFGITDRHQTRWRFSIIPLGGYVKMLGDADASSARSDVEGLPEEDKKYTLHHKTPLQRIAVAIAGPAANFIFAIVVLTLLISIKGLPHIGSTLGIVKEDGLASKAGLKVGDKVLLANNEKVDDFHELRRLIQRNIGETLNLKIERAGQTIDKKIDLFEMDAKGEKKPIKVLGVGPSAPEYKRHNPLMAVFYSIEVTYTLCVDTLRSLGQMLVGQRGGELGGILAIGDMASQSAKSGIATIAWFMAVLSINLGFINLFPIPVLDGGHIVLAAIEGIRKKPLTQKLQERVFLVGFLIVVSLMLFATWNDLNRYGIVSMFLDIFAKIKGIFG